MKIKGIGIVLLAKSGFIPVLKVLASYYSNNRRGKNGGHDIFTLHKENCRSIWVALAYEIVAIILGIVTYCVWTVNTFENHIGVGWAMCGLALVASLGWFLNMATGSLSRILVRKFTDNLDDILYILWVILERKDFIEFIHTESQYDAQEIIEKALDILAERVITTVPGSISNKDAFNYFERLHKAAESICIVLGPYDPFFDEAKKRDEKRRHPASRTDSPEPVSPPMS